VNDRPIRIDVASRPLGGNKSEGFRNKRKLLFAFDSLEFCGFCF